MNMDEIIAIMELGKMLAALTMLLTIAIFALWLWQDFGTGYRGGENEKN